VVVEAVKLRLVRVDPNWTQINDPGTLKSCSTEKLRDPGQDELPNFVVK
jgi:hypothetical protein